MEMAGNPVKAVHQRIDELNLIQNLLGTLAPSNDHVADPKRFNCLKKVITPERQNFFAVLPKKGIRKRLLSRLIEQVEILEKKEGLQVLRALAILHWEWAHQNKDFRLSSESRSLYEKANFIWRMLLTDKLFWPGFAEEHEIEEAHIVELRQQAVDDILAHHLEKAKICLAAGDMPGGRFHVDCLQGWDRPGSMDRSGEESAGQAIEGQGTDAYFDPEVGLEIETKARSLCNNWVSEFLRRGNDQLGDEEALQNLPQGISRNYAGAIAAIKPGLELMPNNQRLLSFSIKQHNGYTNELAFADHVDEAWNMALNAVELSGRLAENYLKPGDSLNPDNQAVYLSFHLANVLANNLGKDSSIRMEYLEECRKWGGSNEEIEFQILRQQVHQAIAEEDFDNAIETIESLEQEYKDNDEIVSLKAVCYFRRGLQSAEKAGQLMENIRIFDDLELAEITISEVCNPAQELLREFSFRLDKVYQPMAVQYDAAVEDMCKALSAQPEHDIIRQNFEQLENARKNGRLTFVLRQAQLVLEKELADLYPGMALLIIQNVDDPELGGPARNLGSAAYFRMGVNCANQENFKDSLSCLEEAVQLDPENDFLREQRDVVAQMVLEEKPRKQLKEASEAFEAEDYRKALTISEKITKNFSQYNQVRQLISACHFREGIRQANNRQFKKAEKSIKQALKGDPGNKIIAEQYEIVSQMAREEKFHNQFQEAVEQFQKGNMDRAVTIAKKIPSKFSQYSQVRELIDTAVRRKRHEQGFEKVNMAVKVLNQAQNGKPLTPDAAEGILKILEIAVEETDSNEEVVKIRDQVRRALRGY